jgi:hypothetical protein
MDGYGTGGEQITMDSRRITVRRTNHREKSGWGYKEQLQVGIGVCTRDCDTLLPWQLEGAEELPCGCVWCCNCVRVARELGNDCINVLVLEEWN